MNFIQIISSFTILSLLFISINGGIRLCEKNERKILEKKNQLQCEKFISESFKQTCNGKGFQNLNQWQETCRAMWNLEYIGWSDAQDFMIVPDNPDFNLMCGIWKSKNSIGEVFSKKDKE